MSGQFLTPGAWRGYRRADFPAKSWAIEGEVLHALPGAEAVSLISRQRFGDFDLSLEWRLPVGGNSGILQLLDDAGHPDGRRPETSCGALYGLHVPHDVPPCAPGVFNIARVSVRGSRLEHWLNGVRVLAYDTASGDWHARVARSKFRGLPHFAHATEGHIVLQHHGGEAWFYNVRVESPALRLRALAGARKR